MSRVKSYFDEQAHQHAYHNDPDVYKFITSLLDDMQLNNSRIKILDIGCGDGAFIKSLLSSKIDADYIATDLSQTMTNLANENINHPNLSIFVSDAFNLPLSRDYKFDLIHIDSVLHHLIGKTRGESRSLSEKLLQILTERLQKNGKLIVEEVYYDSHIYPESTATLIFYSLKFFSKIDMDISKFVKEFHKGLEVSFFSERELYEMLGFNGNPTLIKKIPWKVPNLYKLFLLNKMGHISYMLTKL